MMRSGTRRFWLSIATLILIHAVLLLHASRRNFVVVDEVGHVPAGVSHWLTGTFDAYRVNPPLARMLAALPALLAHPVVDLHSLKAPPGERPEWRLGLDLIASNPTRYFDLVCRARLPGIAWSILCAWLIGLWGRQLYGDWGGIIAVALWCFEPTVLAFAQVVTPDIPAATMGLAATYAFWRYIHRPSWANAWLCGILLGIAQLTKFTLLILYTTWPLIWLLYLPASFGNSQPPAARAKSAMAQALAIIILSVLVINLGYGFRGTGQPLGSFDFVSRTFTGPPNSSTGPSNRFRGHWLGLLPTPVPRDYILGIDVQRGDFEAGFPSYLAGQWRHHGWWYYYLYALVVKLPLGTLALIAWGIGLSLLRYPASRGADELFLILPAAALLAFISSQTGFNHHMRYVLPAFPFLMISAGKLSSNFDHKRWGRSLLVCGMLVWSIISSISVYPHSMSYFNEAAGGPENGHAHLLDSNIDWGQDLLYLKEWLDHHPEAQPLGLAYYQVVDPRIVGIHFHLPPPGPNGLFLNDREYQAKFGPHPGYYAVSVNHLRGTEFVVPDGHGELHHTWRGDYEYFRLFRPIARAGYSIYIYHITPAEAEAVRRRIGLPPLSAPS
jgi:hypothetical protein